jgi:drug/metabolite transporter (DMT)-like permease
MDRSVVKEIPMSPTQIACAVLVPLFWGVQFVVIKVGLTAFPPLFFVGLRFAAVAAILLPFVGDQAGANSDRSSPSRSSSVA